MGLMAGQDLGAGEVFQVLVVGDHINQRDGALEVMSPVLKGLNEATQGWHQGQTTTQRL